MSKESREDPDGKGYKHETRNRKNNNVQISQVPTVYHILALPAILRLE